QVCKAHTIRGSEMCKLGYPSIRFSDAHETLYISSVVLIHLFAAENVRHYDVLKRDWLSKPLLAQVGTKVTPGFHMLEQKLLTLSVDTILDNLPEFTVQAVIRAAMVMKGKLHPCVSRQLKRAKRHIEDEIT